MIIFVYVCDQKNNNVIYYFKMVLIYLCTHLEFYYRLKYMYLGLYYQNKTVVALHKSWWTNSRFKPLFEIGCQTNIAKIKKYTLIPSP